MPCSSASVVDHARDVRRLVALAAVRHRRQKRAVGFDQQPIERHAARRLAQLRAFGKRHDAGERDVEAQRERRRRASAASPVKQCSTPRSVAAAFLAQDRERVLVGLAGVDDDRQLAARAPARTCARNTACCTSRGE